MKLETNRIKTHNHVLYKSSTQDIPFHILFPVKKKISTKLKSKYNNDIMK